MSVQVMRARVMDGTLFRFDSVAELLSFCRGRYHTHHVRTASVAGDFVVYVDPHDRPPFESLIVHFEGERTYAVMLPG